MFFCSIIIKYIFFLLNPIKCNELNINIIWEGEDLNEVAINKDTGKVIIKINPKYYRPTEVDLLIGDPTKAKNDLNWTPKVTFKDLIKIMVEAEIKFLKGLCI